MTSRRGGGLDDLLGLGAGSELLAQAAERWPAWCRSDVRLAVVDDFADLPAWLLAAVPGEADEVLQALVVQAAPDGGDDLAAAAALAKCLLPGAYRLVEAVARTRRSPLTDLPNEGIAASEVVASQLWIEIRSFKWRTRKKVAANILADTRAGVMHECGSWHQLVRTDRTWSRTSLYQGYDVNDDVDDDSYLRPTPSSDQWRVYLGAHKPRVGTMWGPQVYREPTAGPGELTDREELLELLDWACSQEVISHADRDLLLCLAGEADRAGTSRIGSGYCGLLSRAASQRVASRLGTSPATVRRHGARSIKALTVAAPARFTSES